MYVLFTDKIIYVRTMNTDHSPEREGFIMKSFVKQTGRDHLRSCLTGNSDVYV